MEKVHYSVDGDRIDLIVQHHYGSIDMLPEVLSKNIFLSKDTSMIIKSGLKILLPDALELATREENIEDELLW
jgi:phage tail protein X